MFAEFTLLKKTKLCVELLHQCNGHYTQVLPPFHQTWDVR